MDSRLLVGTFRPELSQDRGGIVVLIWPRLRDQIQSGLACFIGGIDIRAKFNQRPHHRIRSLFGRNLQRSFSPIIRGIQISAVTCQHAQLRYQILRRALSWTGARARENQHGIGAVLHAQRCVRSSIEEQLHRFYIVTFNRPHQRGRAIAQRIIAEPVMPSQNRFL